MELCRFQVVSNMVRILRNWNRLRSMSYVLDMEHKSHWAQWRTELPSSVTFLFLSKKKKKNTDYYCVFILFVHNNLTHTHMHFRKVCVRKCLCNVLTCLRSRFLLIAGPDGTWIAFIFTRRHHKRKFFDSLTCSVFASIVKYFVFAYVIQTTWARLNNFFSLDSMSNNMQIV